MFINVKFTSKFTSRELDVEIHISNIVACMGVDDLVEQYTECECQPQGLSSYTDCECYEEWIGCKIEYSIDK